MLKYFLGFLFGKRFKLVYGFHDDDDNNFEVVSHIKLYFFSVAQVCISRNVYKKICTVTTKNIVLLKILCWVQLYFRSFARRSKNHGSMGDSEILN